MKRTDQHRPSVIRPDDYEYVGQECLKIECLGDCLVLQAHRETIRDHMTRTGGKYSHHEHGGNCMVCGSTNAIYTVLFHHRPTNTYIRMGTDCAEKMELSGGDYSAFRAAVEDARHAQAGKRKAQAVLADLGLTRAWEIYATQVEYAGCDCEYDPDFGPCNCYREWKRKQGREEQIIIDLVGKLVTYGEVSEKQTTFLRSLLERIGTRPEREAAEAAAKEAAAPCPTGRVEIDGTVLALKEQDSHWGPVTKMLVQAATGFKVWGTRVGNAEKGQRITFRATVKPSQDDAKFGFFSRPKVLHSDLNTTTEAV